MAWRETYIYTNTSVGVFFLSRNDHWKDGTFRSWQTSHTVFFIFIMDPLSLTILL